MKVVSFFFFGNGETVAKVSSFHFIYIHFVFVSHDFLAVCMTLHDHCLCRQTWMLVTLRLMKNQTWKLVSEFIDLWDFSKLKNRVTFNWSLPSNF